ncbi:uncharacterized protein LOC135946826 [Cloeon dipterum]|uniref:uncharacterized protein LOC135946826 n=1 Tax=Cloeon dipterum TaxID=197152 RepID=UPI00321F7296
MKTTLVLLVTAAVLSYFQLTLAEQPHGENSDMILRKKQGVDLLDHKKLLDVIHILARTNSRLINAAMHAANDESGSDKESKVDNWMKCEQELKEEENLNEQSKVANVNKLVKISI